MRGVLRPNRAVRTLLLTREHVAAFTIDQSTGEFHALAPGPSTVWALLDDPQTVDTLTSDLADALGVRETEAAAIVEEALPTLWELGLLTTGTEGAGLPTGIDLRRDEPITVLHRGPDP